MFELLIFVNLTMGGRPDPNCCDVKFVKVSHLSGRLCNELWNALARSPTINATCVREE